MHLIIKYFNNKSKDIYLQTFLNNSLFFYLQHHKNMNENSENLPNGSSGGTGNVGIPNVNDLNTNGTNKNTIVIDNQPKRRVSIISDPAHEGRSSVGAYDNPAYEQNPRRKISQVSPSSIIRK